MMKSVFFLLILVLALLTCNQAFSKVLTLVTQDNLKVEGTLEKSSKNNKTILLLFHQARSNRHEYDTIIPVFKRLGFDTLAVDQRSGGKMWGTVNQTVINQGRSTGYLSALPDLQAALDWAIEKKYEQIIGVGSSYSAALIFILAQNNPEKLAAIASFSPGEYLGKPNLVKEAVKQLSLPIYMTAASSKVEQERVKDVLSQLVDQSNITRYEPAIGIHGISSLRKDRNQSGAEKNLDQFRGFLKDLRKKVKSRAN